MQQYYWTGKSCLRRICKGEPYNWQTCIDKVQVAYIGGTKPEQSKPSLTPSPTSTPRPSPTSGKILQARPISAGDVNAFTTKLAKNYKLAQAAFAQFSLPPERRRCEHSAKTGAILGDCAAGGAAVLPNFGLGKENLSRNHCIDWYKTMLVTSVPVLTALFGLFGYSFAVFLLLNGV